MNLLLMEGVVGVLALATLAGLIWALKTILFPSGPTLFGSNIERVLWLVAVLALPVIGPLALLVHRNRLVVS